MKNPLTTQYYLVANIAELFLLHALPVERWNGESFPAETPSKAEGEYKLGHPLDSGAWNGEPYLYENNVAIVPADILDRLSEAIQKLDELEQESEKKIISFNSTGF